jgi:hypothetical protein
MPRALVMAVMAAAAPATLRADTDLTPSLGIAVGGDTDEAKRMPSSTSSWATWATGGSAAGVVLRF